MSEQAPADATPAPETPDVTPDPAAEPDALGDAGKRALDAMKAERAAAKAEARVAIARAEAAEAALASKDKSAEEVALETARRETRDSVLKETNLKLAKSALKLAASTKLTNPADALAFIDPSTIEIDANGEADADALDTEINRLLTERPYLAIKPNGFGGGGDGGAGSPPKPEASLAERIAEANAAGNTKLAISLKNTQLKFPA